MNIEDHQKILSECHARHEIELASRNAKVAELIGMREEVVHYQKEFHRIKDERDQLRDQVQMLRDAMLKAASEIRRCDYTPARSTLLTTLAATEPK